MDKDFEYANRRRRIARLPLWAAGLVVGVVLLHTLFIRQESTFTLAIVPDSQHEVRTPDDTRLADRFRWLVGHRKELNLKMVLHTGDIVQTDSPDHIEFQRASAALAILDDANVPYALAIGNHDAAAGNTNAGLRDTTTFNRYFPATRQSRLRGFYERRKVDNAYQTFQAGGLNWLVIHLEMWPRAGAVNWAGLVAERHPNYNIIVITHSYLTRDSAIEQRNGGYGDSSPQFVFDRFLSIYPNIRLVFSGHTGTYGYRTDKGIHGNTIYSFLGAYHSTTDNPVRLLTIDTRRGTMTTRVFCPSTGKDKESGSAFTITGIHWVPASADNKNLIQP